MLQSANQHDSYKSCPLVDTDSDSTFSLIWRCDCRMWPCCTAVYNSDLQSMWLNCDHLGHWHSTVQLKSLIVSALGNLVVLLEDTISWWHYFFLRIGLCECFAVGVLRLSGFHCYTGKRASSTSTSPTANNNPVPTESGHNTGSTPDPCNATLDAIMLGEPEVSTVWQLWWRSLSKGNQMTELDNISLNFKRSCLAWFIPGEQYTECTNISWFSHTDRQTNQGLSWRQMTWKTKTGKDHKNYIKLHLQSRQTTACGPNAAW